MSLVDGRLQIVTRGGNSFCSLRLASILWHSEAGQRLDDPDGFEADGDDLSDEAEDVLGVIFPIWVVSDAGTLVG